MVCMVGALPRFGLCGDLWLVLFWGSFWVWMAILGRGPGLNGAPGLGALC